MGVLMEPGQSHPGHMVVAAAALDILVEEVEVVLAPAAELIVAAVLVDLDILILDLLIMSYLLLIELMLVSEIIQWKQD